MRPVTPKIKNILHWISWILVVILLVMGGMIGGYFVGFHQAEKELLQEREKNELLIEQIREIAAIDEQEPSPTKAQTQKREIEALQKELKELLAREQDTGALKPQHEYAPDKKHATPPPPPKREIVDAGTEAKLVIIIDDVSYSRDVNAIKSTGLPLTMSFLPPTQRHPESAILALSEKEYMVHLPLEAMSYNHEEPYTLKVDDDEKTIRAQIQKIKRLYPNVRYINNHTGSKYTADRAAMERLMQVMKEENLIFVDSRTTPQTKVPEAVKTAGQAYMGRDVFLDHTDGVDNIKRQIKDAIRIAKKHGSAIAIGHPRKDTIQALKESKELLQNVKIVTISQL